MIDVERKVLLFLLYKELNYLEFWISRSIDLLLICRFHGSNVHLGFQFAFFNDFDDILICILASS